MDDVEVPSTDCGIVESQSAPEVELVSNPAPVRGVGSTIAAVAIASLLTIPSVSVNFNFKRDCVGGDSKVLSGQLCRGIGF